MRLFIALLILSASASAKDSVETLMKLDEQFCRETAERGVDGWMAYFDENPVLFRPDGPIMRTKAEAYEHYRKTFGPGKINLRWKPLGGVISSSGDLGFTYGTWQSGAGTGKYQTTWRKGKDGKWKIVADIGNPDAPPQKK